MAASLLASVGVTGQGNFRTLKDAYKDHFSIDVSVNMGNLLSTDRAGLIKKQFNSITAENDMKPISTQPNEGWWNFSNSDNIMRFAETNNIPVRGHCLIWHNQTDSIKRERIYDMVKQMKAAGVPIHGIGMQGHYNVASPTEDELRAAIKRYREVVDVIHVTELDVRINTHGLGGQLQTAAGGPESFSREADLAQTRQYGMLFRVFRENRDIIRNVTFWNTDDGDSWLDRRWGNTARNYPLLFDDDLRPKSAYYEVVMFDNPHRAVRAEMKPWTAGGRESGKYRNLFLEAGYTQEEIDRKIADAWYRIFESSYRVYQEAGDDMAYISDVKNKDIRTEGM